MRCQWRSHRERGQGGQSAPPDSEKKKPPISGKREGNREKEEKSGRFFHFAPPDR